jgi:RNA polymerase sigma factor (sigma-70 family)
MGTKDKTIYPWTDKDGHLLSEQELERVSKSWSGETWDQYLKTFEVPLKESQSSEFRTLAENLKENLFQYSQTTSNEELKAIVEVGLLALTDLERRVLRLIFFESQSEREIASQIFVSRSRVQNLKRSGLKKLKDYFLGVSTFPIEKATKKTKEKNHAEDFNKTDLENDSSAF